MKNLKKINEMIRATKSWGKAYHKAKKIGEKEAARHNYLEMIKMLNLELLKEL